MTATHSPGTAFDAERLVSHRAALLQFVRGLVGHRATAEDITQEALLAALTREGGVRGTIEAYTFGAARRLVARAGRDSARRRRRETVAARPEGLPSAAEVVSRIERRRRILAALEGLAEPYRTTLYLRYFEDLPPRAIAARTGAPVETVRSRVRRGLELLRARLVGPDRRRAAPAFALLAPWRRILEGLAVKKTIAAAAVILAVLLLVALTNRQPPTGDPSTANPGRVAAGAATATEPGPAEAAEDRARVTPGAARPSADDAAPAPGRAATEDTALPRIAGVLVDSSGTPVEAQTVFAATVRRGGPWLEAVTGDDGTFVLAGVPDEALRAGVALPGRTYEDLATFEGPTDDARLVWDVPPPQDLLVRVVDATGDAIPRARLTVRDIGLEALRPGASIGARIAREVVDGAASVTLRPRGALVLHVSAATDAAGTPLAAAPVEMRVETVGPEPIEIVLGRGAEIRGRVVRDGGRGVGEVTVRAWEERSNAAPAPESALRPADARVTTGPDGSFVIPGLNDRMRVQLEATAPPGFARPERASATAGSSEVVIIELPTAAALAGRVVHPDGSPVTSGRVEAYVRRTTPSQPGRLSTRIGDDGLFRIEGVPAGLTVTLRAESTQPEDAGRFAPCVLPDVPADAAGLTLRLSEGVRIRGVVVDADGVPYTECVVMGRMERRPSTYATVAPAADGTFELPVAEEGVYTLRAMRGSSITAPVRASAPGDGVRLVVASREDPNGRSISGIVRLAGGEPATQGAVHASWPATAHTPAGRCSTGIRHDGRFVTKLIPTDVTVTLRAVVADAAHRASHAPGTLEGVRPGDERIEIRVPEGVEIAGVVRGVDGEPMAGIAVRADVAGASPEDGRWAAAQSDSAGRFVVVVAEPGEYELTAFRQMRIAGPVAVTAPAGGVELRVPAPRTLTGVVHGADGGLADLLVRGETVSAGRTRIVHDRTDATGRFALTLPDDAGEVVVTVVRADESGSDGFGRAVVAAGESQVTVELRPATRLAGILRSADGRPLVGDVSRAMVVAEGPDRTASARVGDDGSFEIRALPEGHYELRLLAFPNGARHEEPLASAVDAGRTDIDVTTTLVR